MNEQWFRAVNVPKKAKKMFLLYIAIISGCISAISVIIAENLTYNPFLGFFYYSQPIFLYDIYSSVFLIFMMPTLFCGFLWFGINFLLEGDVENDSNEQVV